VFRIIFSIISCGNLPKLFCKIFKALVILSVSEALSEAVPEALPWVLSEAVPWALESLSFISSHNVVLFFPVVIFYTSPLILQVFHPTRDLSQSFSTKLS
jgi:hypothetical protein